jgi:5-methylcytosine-specific restriction endonuclease McrA
VDWGSILFVGGVIAIVVIGAAYAVVEKRKEDKRVTRGCSICGDATRREHACYAWASVAKGGRHAPLRTRAGYIKERKWRAVVRDRLGIVWESEQDYMTKSQAQAAAVRALRQLQWDSSERPQVVPTTPRVTAPHPVRAPIEGMSDAAWLQLLEQQQHRCFYCGEPSGVFHREHRIPLARGGKNNLANIVAARPRCNLRKHILTDTEFFEALRIGATRARPDIQPLLGAVPRALRGTNAPVANPHAARLLQDERRGAVVKCACGWEGGPEIDPRSVGFPPSIGAQNALARVHEGHFASLPDVERLRSDAASWTASKRQRNRFIRERLADVTVVVMARWVFQQGSGWVSGNSYACATCGAVRWPTRLDDAGSLLREFRAVMSRNVV